MYIRNAYAIQSYACVCISVTLVQPLRNLVAKVSPGTILAPATAGLRGPYLIQEHNSLPMATRAEVVLVLTTIPHTE